MAIQPPAQIRALEEKRGTRPTPILALTAHALKEAGPKHRSRLHGSSHQTHSKTALLDAISRYVREPPAGGRIQVAVEPWLKPVIGRYVEKRRNDVAKLRSALGEGDYAAIRILGHQMAGSGAGYGLEPITEIGRELEESALAGDAARMRERIDGLDGYLSNIEVD